MIADGGCDDDDDDDVVDAGGISRLGNIRFCSFGFFDDLFDAGLALVLGDIAMTSVVASLIDCKRDNGSV